MRSPSPLTWFVVLAFASRAPLVAQGAGALPRIEPRPAVPAFLSVLSPLLIPKMFADEYEVREFIRSDEFADVRYRYGDLYAVDAIFDMAMRVCWENRGEALFVSSIATMDHRRVGFRVPLLGPLLWLPLTSEFEEEHGARCAALPRRLYPDSPPGDAGDRDKLQHFFGSAFLAFVTESRVSSSEVGEFVEWGEERFVVGGVRDPRDMRANHQGTEFGLALLHDPATLPSTYLRSAPEDPAPSIPPVDSTYAHNREAP